MALNAVIDISHFNGDVDFQQAAASGILGVIHKATQGTSYTDPTYEEHRQQALAAGLLWGAYHFGVSGDGVAQADYFLGVVANGGSVESTLLVLDFETNTQGTSMSIVEAHAFITHVQATTGRYPGLYSGQYVKQLLGGNTDPVLAQCWFWLSQYGPTAVVPPTWKTWTLWQYTDGGMGNGPYTVPGVGRCDRDQFNGEEEGLRRLWGAGGAG